MLKLIILIGLIYIVYKAFEFWQKLNTVDDRVVSDKTDGQIDDIMVQDPFCGVYFPRKEGIHLRKGGSDLYFCSNECKDKFLESGRKE